MGDYYCNDCETSFDTPDLHAWGIYCPECGSENLTDTRDGCPVSWETEYDEWREGDDDA